MAFGVAYYSSVVGILTSAFAGKLSSDNKLSAKLKVLESFNDEYHVDPKLYKSLRQFVQMNYLDIFKRVDDEQMLNELPITLREEVLFHQYGAIILKFEFFEKLKNDDLAWDIVKHLE